MELDSWWLVATFDHAWNHHDLGDADSMRQGKGTKCEALQCPLTQAGSSSRPGGASV
jgi:hypothetical protein